MKALKRLWQTIEAWYNHGMHWKDFWFYVQDDDDNELSSEFIECYKQSDIVAYCTRVDGSKYYLLSSGRKVEV
jgi:hypothetical protein